ncbi:MAG: thermonuclease family protein [Luteolibacter sp.]
MSRKSRSKSSSIFPILIVVAAVVIWVFDAYRQGNFQLPSLTEKDPAQSQTIPSDRQGTSPIRTGRYDTYRGCTLVQNRGNDGDSFRVKLPEGRTEIIRLYFVDTPESAFKNYGGGRNNHDRIADQAEDMGRISSQQAVEIGKKAKDFVLSLLSGNPFTLHTEWDSPFNDQRYHGFIEVEHKGKTRFLHELLIEHGYARIHTKGGQLPDGTSERKQEDHLFHLERSARSNKVGAWGL